MIEDDVMDQIVVPNSRKLVQDAFAALDKLDIAPKKQANVFLRTLQFAAGLQELRAELASSSNEEVATRAKCVVDISKKIKPLSKTHLKRWLNTPRHALNGGFTPKQMMTSEKPEHLGELLDFLDLNPV